MLQYFYRLFFCLFVAIPFNLSAQTKKTQIVVTTSILGDAVIAMVGDLATVDVLMGPGVDPHLYQATPRDIRLLRDANIIISHGFHLEGRMADILHRLGSGKQSIEASQFIPQQELIKVEGDQIDPHIWFDPYLWRSAIDGIGKKLGSFLIASSSTISQNAQRYLDEIDSANSFVVKCIQSVPESKRILVTAHDAFSYFGRRYGMKVKGVQGISTDSEPSISDVSRLVDILVENKIPSVFIESTVSPKTIKALTEGADRRGHAVKIGGELFSDALGDKNSDGSNYFQMLKHNAKTIAEALGGSCQ